MGTHWTRARKSMGFAAAVVAASCSMTADSNEPVPADAARAGSLALTRHGRPTIVSSPPQIRKFITSLPGLGTAGANEIGQHIPLATKRVETLFGVETDVYELVATEFAERMHPDLPNATRLWGYADDSAHATKSYLGGAIVARRGRPVLLKVRNGLPNRALVPVDLGLPASEDLLVKDLPFNRITTHLHGGFTPWFSDGTPFQWYTPSGLRGASFMNVPGVDTDAGTATHYYPNDQSARLLWYHDHAMGLTRTNAYAGLASAYLLTDDFEASLISDGILPDLGIPLVIQDKGFVPHGIRTLDPSWRWGRPGDLWYPHLYSGEPQGTNLPPLPDPSIVPEAFFDTPLVNGGLYPVLRVDDHRVRLRILNGSQGRFWHLNLYAEDASTPGEADLTKPGPTMIQLGSEGGFLPDWTALPNGRPLAWLDVSVANPAGPFNLLLAPAERADVLVDFAGWEGRSLIFYNDAPAPFPSGSPDNDYFTGRGATRTGYGPNTRTVMKLVVEKGSPDTVPTRSVLRELSTRLRHAYRTGVQPPKLYTGPLPYRGPVARRVTLNEGFDAYGRLIQTLGTLSDAGSAVPLGYMDPSTENPARGGVEVWQIYNLSADTHPVHFHLVNVQVIERAAIDAENRIVRGTEREPDANELGWKETVRANPGEVTTVIASFDLPSLPAAMGDPVSPRTGGHEYVWHCHILEHEEHDMMRPLVVH
jgi:spore coat protein A, manganese oxidase